jgi:hypothetical protein
MGEVIDRDNLHLPYWLFTFEELCEVLKCTGAAINTPEIAILNEFIPAAKRQFLGANADGRHLTCDTPSPYRMTLVVQYIDEAMGRLEKPDNLAPYQRLRLALQAVMDALTPLGVTHIDLPLTPDRVWRSIRDAKKGGKA